MLTISNFALNNAIIHRLNNQVSDGLELSSFALDLEDDFKEVLELHSKNALTDKKIRYTKYINAVENTVHSETTRFVNGEAAFIEYSHMIAKRLYSFMGNKAISPGDLLVADISINGNRHIALLKLDYKNQYLSKVEDIGGKKKISIEKKDNAWPEAGTRLQKAAFIRSNLHLEDDTIYDVIMLDRQNRQTSIDDNAASLFFSNSFLNVKLIEDTDSNTIAFIKGAQEIKSKYASLNISQEKAKEIYDYAISQVLTVDKINVNNFAENFFDREEGFEEQFNEVKSIFESNGLKRTEFDKSKTIAEKYSRNRKIFLNGIKLTIDNNIYNDSDRFKIKSYKNSAGIEVADITITGLEIKKWE
ncbi:hypothetical protein [Lysinibacillus sp. NPDC059133]|uniref:hypothetical protein n=1 Tax=Lysinibacillus sp. NPDC059133 TaxID=3346737 RepID=UPI003684616F